jgi:hypothetical protein
MQEAVGEMKLNEEGIEKLTELEIAFISVCCVANLDLAAFNLNTITAIIRLLCDIFSFLLKVPVTPEESKTLRSRGRAVAIQVKLPAAPLAPLLFPS